MLKHRFRMSVLLAACAAALALGGCDTTKPPATTPSPDISLPVESCRATAPVSPPEISLPVEPCGTISPITPPPQVSLPVEPSRSTAPAAP